MLAIASDHGGFALKQAVMAHLDARGIEYRDLGTYTDQSCDYPDFGRAAAEAVASGECEKGIVICTTGIGISISANKIRGIRCALPQNIFAATMAKEHNDANFIAFGGRIDYQDDVLDMVKAYISTQVSQDERHARRRAKMMALEG